MNIRDERTDEQKQTHTVLVVGTCRVLSHTRNFSPGPSYAAWACKPEHQHRCYPEGLRSCRHEASPGC
jgi:hypothetical protein